MPAYLVWKQHMPIMSRFLINLPPDFAAPFLFFRKWRGLCGKSSSTSKFLHLGRSFGGWPEPEPEETTSKFPKVVYWD
jgi:hypothetical protein